MSPTRPHIVLEDMRDMDGDPVDVAVAQVRQLERLAAAFVGELERTEAIVCNAIMQEALDIGAPLTGRHDADPYTHWLESREAGVVARAQGAAAVCATLAADLRRRLMKPALQRD